MEMATPHRPLPGAFFNTPAPTRPGATAQRPPAFRLPSGPVAQRQPSSTALSTTGSSAVPPTQPQNAISTQTPEQQAASKVSYKLSAELKYPALEDYIIQGISSDYDIPSSTAWAPFEKSKSFEIPEKILEQLNEAHMSTKLGLFAELHHAWATVDNVLYIWDYTHPNPELVGCDELSHTIIEVKLAKPKLGVFKSEITHVLLIATVSEIAILALSANRSPEGIVSVGLYQTDLRVPLKGLQASRLIASVKNGRVFFGCRNSNDVFEITYQKEEKWFANKCSRINHTAKDVRSVFVDFAYSIASTAPVAEYVRHIELDDTRDLLYVLSSKSTIRVFHIKEPNQLILVISRTLKDVMGNVVHMVPSSSEKLFPKDQQIVSISTIPRTESSRIALLATTRTGVRLFLSVTSGSYYYADSGGIPSSMQVQHIKFPPSTRQIEGQSVTSTQATNGAVETDSMILTPTALAARFSPGFNFSFVNRDEQHQILFISAPDSGRLGRTPEAGSTSKFLETAQFVPLAGVAEDIGSVTPPFAANNAPAGFGNELSVQFDQSPTEIAVLTNTGIHLFRRRRLVDTFSAALRSCATEEDFDGAIKKFVRLYGRVETCASAFAVACGQGLDGQVDSRTTNVLTDREVIEYARRTITEHGGKPDAGESLDATQPSIDNVRPSSRAQALILYTSRLVRSVWSGKVVREVRTPTGGLSLASSVPLKKLQTVSLALLELQKFLQANKSFIPGLSGPEEIVRVASVTERTALQGEHQVLNSQIKIISSITEGIAFLTQLFEQPVQEIVLALPENYRHVFRDLTYQDLFTATQGRSLAKELVKAIVNRNIAAGSNVDTVADALQRRCGSFCSTDDVLIFKAQEKLQKAIEAGPKTSSGRSLLNDSLNLFSKVAGSLSSEYLQTAVGQYINMSFYAGAISLCLSVAQAKDKGNAALSWIKDGKPQSDSRESLYAARTRCYEQIFKVIKAVDSMSAPSDGQTAAIVATQREEAYSVIGLSEDEVFQNCLYDWYLANDWSQRLLDITSRFVVPYLRRMSEQSQSSADLLWKYFAHHKEYFEAANVQLELAKSSFSIDLKTRIEYLSRAKANTSTRMSTYGRVNGSRQEVVRDITDQLDCATIQLDVLRKLESDPRLIEPNRTKVISQLNGRVLSLDELYNDFVNLAGYHELSLVIFYLSDYRNAAEIKATWENMVHDTHEEAGRAEDAEPYVRIQEQVRALAHRVNVSEIVFSPYVVLSVLLSYTFQASDAHSPNPSRGPSTWPVDLLLGLGITPDVVLVALENLLFNEPSYTGSKKRLTANLIVYVSQRWLRDSTASGSLVGGVEGAEAVLEALRAVQESMILRGSVDEDTLRQALVAVQRAF